MFLGRFNFQNVLMYEIFDLLVIIIYEHLKCRRTEQRGFLTFIPRLPRVLTILLTPFLTPPKLNVGKKTVVESCM